MMDFPEGFTWGVSTSAYQIEGATREGGRGEGIWDSFTRRPGRVADGSSGEVATDHYRRYREDVALLAELGVGAYRFSLSWPRLQPSGRGRLNTPGLDFYRRLIDALHASGIAPWPCLYHWDLPQALQDRGGWANRDSASYLADYAAAVAEELAGSITELLLLNEPNVHALLGHLVGVHAPGLTGMDSYLPAVHHQNLATGLALRQVRQVAPALRLGTILNLQPVAPAEAGEEHEVAAQLVDACYNRSALDPLLLGAYPQQLASLLEALIGSDDMAVIAQPLDLLGVNHYTRLRVLAEPSAPLGLRLAEAPLGAEVTEMGWEVAPAALSEQLDELRLRYGNPPVYLTENGAAFADRAGASGRVEDRRRADYLTAYLRAVADARSRGCDVRGYFVWTLVDNFEWSHGFSRRFGLVELDLATLERRKKRSFDVYRQIVRSGRLPGRD